MAVRNQRQTAARLYLSLCVEKVPTLWETSRQPTPGKRAATEPWSLQDCVSQVVVCSTGAPQETKVSPFSFFTVQIGLQTQLWTMPPPEVLQWHRHRWLCVKGEWTGMQRNHCWLCGVAWGEPLSKTKEVVIGFCRTSTLHVPVNIQGLNTEVAESFKYVGVYFENADALYQKGQSCLHLLQC